MACRMKAGHSATQPKWLTTLSCRQPPVCGFEETPIAIPTADELRAYSHSCVGVLERWISSPCAVVPLGLRKLVNPWEPGTESTLRPSVAGWTFPFLHSPVLNQLHRAKWRLVIFLQVLNWAVKQKNTKFLYSCTLNRQKAHTCKALRAFGT